MVGLEIGVGRFWSNWVHLVTVTFTQLLRALSIPKVRTARSDYGRSRTKHFGNETGFFQEKGGKDGGKEVGERSGKGRQRRKRNTNRPKQYSSRAFYLTSNKHTLLRGRKPVQTYYSRES